MKKKILSIAGSDSSGGAGIQADISTITNLGGVAMTAITAVTAQDETQVYSVHDVPLEFIKEQIEVTINSADAVKTGMLGNAEVIKIISSLLPSGIPIVVDPVMFSTSGYRLLSKNAIQIMKYELLPKALLITPNIPEAESLVNSKITNTQDMIEVGQKILLFGVKAVLMKGGHLIQDNKISDILILKGEQHFFTHDVIHAKSTHGTGCKLSAAIACSIAQGKTLKQSIEQAINHVSNSLLQ